MSQDHSEHASLTVAVTGLAGGENPQPGVGVVRSLRDAFPDLTVVGLAYDVWESGIYADGCADVVYHLPKPSEGRETIRERLAEIFTEHPVDVFIPTLDSELASLIELQPDLTAWGVQTMLPSADALRRSRKSELLRLAESVGCETPRTRAVNTESAAVAAAHVVGWPVVVKGPFCGAEHATTEAEVVAAFRSLLATWGGPVVVQERIDGPEFCVMGVGDGAGHVSASCTVRKTVVSAQGKGFAGVSVAEPRLKRQVARIVESLRWNGPFELEFLYDERADCFVLIEMNPRFPAWVNFPTALGHNQPQLVVRSLLSGFSGTLDEPAPGAFFVRHSREVVGRIEDLGRLRMTGRLGQAEVSADAQ